MRHWQFQTIVVIGAGLISTGIGAPAAAQGIIFGSVAVPGGEPPPAQGLYWMGFLDGTDEEVRIETNVGSGYDGAFWFDDFQNYTTEAAGSRYDYIFQYPSGGFSARIGGSIPDNSFQSLDVVLTDTGSPLQPVITAAVVLPGDHVRLDWPLRPGFSHRVYRRTTENNGLFRRVDDPAGDTANHGVDDTVFVDTSALPGIEYSYIIVGVGTTGQLTPHSAEAVPAPQPTCQCPFQADISADNSPDAVDLQLLIDIVFFGGTTVRDPSCPMTRADMDCSGFDDATDLALMIDYIFFGGPPPCDPCL